MKIIKQSHQILNFSSDLLKNIEVAGRTCYKSEDKITEESASKFVQNLVDRKHHAMIEFGDITVRFITNRGVTHELVRHRLCSFAQESTRYVNYGGDDIEFIKPVWSEDKIFPGTAEDCWYKVCSEAEDCYKRLLFYGWKPQQAREVLPNSLKTEIVVKANIREWRHIFKLRCNKSAHPQMRALMIPLLEELKGKIPIVFNDITY